MGRSAGRGDKMTINEAERAVPTSVFDYESQYLDKDIAQDIANGEGCCICRVVCDRSLWLDSDGFVYCDDCQPDTGDTAHYIYD